MVRIGLVQPCLVAAKEKFAKKKQSNSSSVAAVPAAVVGESKVFYCFCFFLVRVRARGTENLSP